MRGPLPVARRGGGVRASSRGPARLSPPASKHVDHRSPLPVHLLERLPEETASRIVLGARRRRFDRGTIIFHEGDPADTVHVVRRGRVAVEGTTPLGDTVILTVLGPGDMVGELALVAKEQPRSATVIALETAETLAIHRADFARLRREHRETDDVIIEVLAEQVRRLSVHVMEALHVSAPTRVRRRLMFVADLYLRQEATPDNPITIPLTQEQIAQLAGTTRPTVNEVLAEERDLGAVVLGRGRIEIVDLPALRGRSERLR